MGEEIDPHQETLYQKKPANVSIITSLHFVTANPTHVITGRPFFKSLLFIQIPRQDAP